MDFSKLSQGAKIALIGGAVLIIDLFLPWYGAGASVDLGPLGSYGASYNWNAFSAGFLAWFGALIAIAAAVILLLKAMGTSEVNAGQFKTEQLAVIGGGIGFVLIVLRLLTETHFMKFGLWIGIIAAAAVTYGAFMSMKAAGENLPGMG